MEVRLSFAGQVPVEEAVARLLGIGGAPMETEAAGPVRRAEPGAA